MALSRSGPTFLWDSAMVISNEAPSQLRSAAYNMQKAIGPSVPLGDGVAENPQAVAPPGQFNDDLFGIRLRVSVTHGLAIQEGQFA